MRKSTVFTLIALVVVHFICLDMVAGQSGNNEIFAPMASSRVFVDGVLSEEIWQQATMATGFMLNFPNDSAQASAQTSVAIAFDQENIYVGAVCEILSGHSPTATTLKRDFGDSNDDFFAVALEPYGDGANGFYFAISPMGVMTEALISDGSNLNTGWDNRWKGQVTVSDSSWTVEMAIPLKTLRFKSGTKEMGINFTRNNISNNERSTWVRVPINFRMQSLAFNGDVHFEQSLQSPGTNISLIPYVTSKLSKQHYSDDVKVDTTSNYTWSAGGDAKIAISPSLNLDLTINPDFSQVEVDRQVTNLDRFEIFFPERRQFFLENEDLFARFGFSKIRPFFSRRIGIGTDSTTNTIVQNPILFGARLSGKLSPDLRVGLLNIQTAQDDVKGLSPNNYTVAAAQYKVFARSNIGAIVVNRTNASDLSDYTRVAGLDYNLQSHDGRWWGKFYAHKAFLPNSNGDAITHASFLRYRGRNWTMAWNHEYVDSDYQINDIGYVKRQPHWRLEPNISYNWFPAKSENINRVTVTLAHDLYTKLNWSEITDYRTQAGINILFKSRSSFSASADRNYIEIINDPFNPTGSDSAFAVGSRHRFAGVSTGLNSAPGRKLRYSFNARYAEFYSGTLGRVGGSIGYQLQPYGAIGITAQYNKIDLPEEDGFQDAELMLIGLSMNVSFTKSVFLSSFVQYNNQTNNINHNTRLQWRFAPVSDFYIVYSENYTSSDLDTKNRALVVKFTYWLNM